MAAKSSSAIHLVDRFFYLIEKFGTFSGCRLFCSEPRSRLSNLPGFCISFLVIAVNLLVIALLILSVIPLPSDLDRAFKLDVPTVSAFFSIFFAVDQSSRFLTLNYANTVLHRKEGFYEKCRQYVIRSRMTTGHLKRWRWATLARTCFVFVITLLSMTFLALIQFNILKEGFPTKFDRVSSWISVPPSHIHVFILLVSYLGGVQLSYSVILFSSLCELVRAQMELHCEKLRSESVDSFNAPRLMQYQYEYAELAEMIECLDDAFGHTCTSQLFLFITEACFDLFCWTREGTPLMFELALVFWLILMVCVFVYFAAPAILLRAAGVKPKKLLRIWFLKYEQACAEKGVPINMESGQALGNFVQWITSENVGISVSSIAKLEGPLLLNIGSVVITYFLVILNLSNLAGGNEKQTGSNATL